MPKSIDSSNIDSNAIEVQTQLCNMIAFYWSKFMTGLHWLASATGLAKMILIVNFEDSISCDEAHVPYIQVELSLALKFGEKCLLSLSLLI